MSDKPTGVLTTQVITKEALRILEQQLLNEVRYYKVRGLDGKYYIAKGYPSGPGVKDGLTSEEADTYLKLLKEQ